jgi:hypothetical protein
LFRRTPTVGTERLGDLSILRLIPAKKGSRIRSRAVCLLRSNLGMDSLSF